MDAINNILKVNLPFIYSLYYSNKDKFYQKIQAKLDKENPDIKVTDYKDEIDEYIVNYKQQIVKKGQTKKDLEKLVKLNQTYEQFLEEVENKYPGNDFSDEFKKEIYTKISEQNKALQKPIKFVVPKSQYYINDNIKTNIGGDFFYFDLPVQSKKETPEDSDTDSDSETDTESDSDKPKISKKDKKLLEKLDNISTGYIINGVNIDLGGELLTKNITFKPDILLTANTRYKYLYLDNYDLKLKTIYFVPDRDVPKGTEYMITLYAYLPLTIADGVNKKAVMKDVEFIEEENKIKLRAGGIDFLVPSDKVDPTVPSAPVGPGYLGIYKMLKTDYNLLLSYKNTSIVANITGEQAKKKPSKKKTKVVKKFKLFNDVISFILNISVMDINPDIFKYYDMLDSNKFYLYQKMFNPDFEECLNKLPEEEKMNINRLNDLIITEKVYENVYGKLNEYFNKKNKNNTFYYKLLIEKFINLDIIRFIKFCKQFGQFNIKNIEINYNELLEKVNELLEYFKQKEYEQAYNLMKRDIAWIRKEKKKNLSAKTNTLDRNMVQKFLYLNLINDNVAVIARKKETQRKLLLPKDFSAVINLDRKLYIQQNMYGSPEFIESDVIFQQLRDLKQIYLSDIKSFNKTINDDDCFWKIPQNIFTVSHFVADEYKAKKYKQLTESINLIDLVKDYIKNESMSKITIKTKYKFILENYDNLFNSLYDLSTKDIIKLFYIEPIITDDLDNGNIVPSQNIQEFIHSDNDLKFVDMEIISSNNITLSNISKKMKLLGLSKENRDILKQKINQYLYKKYVYKMTNIVYESSYNLNLDMMKIYNKNQIYSKAEEVVAKLTEHTPLKKLIDEETLKEINTLLFFKPSVLFLDIIEKAKYKNLDDLPISEQSDIDTLLSKEQFVSKKEQYKKFLNELKVYIKNNVVSIYLDVNVQKVTDISAVNNATKGIKLINPVKDIILRLDEQIKLLKHFNEVFTTYNGTFDDLYDLGITKSAEIKSYDYFFDRYDDYEQIKEAINDFVILKLGEIGDPNIDERLESIQDIILIKYISKKYNIKVDYTSDHYLNKSLIFQEVQHKISKLENDKLILKQNTLTQLNFRKYVLNKDLKDNINSIEYNVYNISKTMLKSVMQNWLNLRDKTVYENFDLDKFINDFMETIWENYSYIYDKLTIFTSSTSQSSLSYFLDKITELYIFFYIDGNNTTMLHKLVKPKDDIYLGDLFIYKILNNQIDGSHVALSSLNEKLSLFVSPDPIQKQIIPYFTSIFIKTIWDTSKITSKIYKINDYKIKYNLEKYQIQIDFGDIDIGSIHKMNNVIVNDIPPPIEYSKIDLTEEELHTIEEQNKEFCDMEIDWVFNYLENKLIPKDIDSISVASEISEPLSIVSEPVPESPESVPKPPESPESVPESPESPESVPKAPESPESVSDDSIFGSDSSVESTSPKSSFSMHNDNKPCHNCGSTKKTFLSFKMGKDPVRWCPNCLEKKDRF